MAVVISSEVVVNQPPGGIPLTHARIGYRNILEGSSVTGSSAPAGESASNVLTNFTYERFAPSSSVSFFVTFDLGTAESANYCGIAAHNLGSISASVFIQTSPDNSTWSTIEEFKQPTDDAIMVLFDSRSSRYWRVFCNDYTKSAEIGVIKIGNVLAMERPIYGGHGPITLNRTVEKRNVRSESGQFLGNTVVRRGQSTSYNWQHLTASWYRANFDPFAEYAESKPFFIAWRPADYPDEVGFVEAVQPAAPSNMGIRNLMQVSMQVRGFSE